MIFYRREARDNANNEISFDEAKLPPHSLTLPGVGLEPFGVNAIENRSDSCWSNADVLDHKGMHVRRDGDYMICYSAEPAFRKIPAIRRGNA